MAVVEARGADDVVATVRAAREHGLPLAVESTGHGAVRACEGGILLSTGRMCGVRIDVHRRTAVVRAGTPWQDVVDAAAPYDLAPVSGTSPAVGVTGYTLGGGTGWLSRRHGLASDGLRWARVVTVDGEVRDADEHRHPDLFWALRGGGGNVGVVTELEVGLHPTPRVRAGLVFLPGERTDELLACYAALAGDEPDGITTSVVLVSVPDSPDAPPPVRGRRVACLCVCSVLDDAETDRHLAPLYAAGGTVLLGGLSTMTYSELQGILGPPDPPQAGYECLDLLETLPGAVVETLTRLDPGTSVEVRHRGGAIARGPRDAGPQGHREVSFSVMLKTRWADRGRLAGPLGVIARHATGGSVLNFLTDPALVETAFTGSDLRRLAAVKATYDPDNVLSVNHNIAPAAPAVPVG